MTKLTEKQEKILYFSAWNIFSVIAFVYLYKIGVSPRTFTPLAFMGNFYLFVFKFKMHEPKEEDEEISFKSGVFVCILDVIIILLLFVTIIVLKKAELVKNFGILLIIYAMFGEKYRKKVFEKIRTRK